MPDPQLLPIRINMIIIRPDGKDKIDFQNLFQVKPYETIDSLKSQLKELYETKQNPITNFDLDQIIVAGPLFSGSIEDNITDDGQNSHKVGASNKISVIDTTLSFNEIGLSMQNSTVYFFGNILFKSDKPLECLTLQYSKDDPAQTKYNYFSCKTCNINWVCQWCKEGCHSGHDVLVHISDHRPTWACCFCVKKGFCKIDNNKNRKKHDVK